MPELHRAGARVSRSTGAARPRAGLVAPGIAFAKHAPMLLSLRAVAVALMLLTPAVAWPCSLAERPSDLEFLQGRAIAPVGDAGADATPPGKAGLSNPRVTLVRDACDGSGAACPQLDALEVTVAASDDQTPAARLRYVAYFSATAQEVAAASTPELLFGPNRDSATTVSAWLGLGSARGEQGFGRKTLCFALAAVDEAANVGERSDALCLDTTDTTAATTTLVQGTPCGGGCAGCAGSGSGAAVVLGLGALLRRRRRA